MGEHGGREDSEVVEMVWRGVRGLRTGEFEGELRRGAGTGVEDKLGIALGVDVEVVEDEVVVVVFVGLEEEYEDGDGLEEGRDDEGSTIRGML